LIASVVVSVQSEGKHRKKTSVFMFSSAVRALYWESVVQLILTALFVGFSATDSACGLNLECFRRFASLGALMMPSTAFGFTGLRATRAQDKAVTCTRLFLWFGLAAFAAAAIQAFVAVNFPFHHVPLLQPTYSAAVALTAAMGITSLVVWQSGQSENQT